MIPNKYIFRIGLSNTTDKDFNNLNINNTPTNTNNIINNPTKISDT